jgi:uncharacterized protein (TIGR03083 family)
MRSPAEIIPTAHLFPELDEALVSLLKGLDRADWRRPTLAPRWTVHHVAAHLLDTACRRLSLCRDGFTAEADPIASERDLIDLINRLNAEGVAVLGRYSPELIIAMMEVVTPQLAAYFVTLDPMAPAAFPVSWAGEERSLNWFDTARELTERWHHQQQIRLATHRPGLMTPRLYAPVLATFMHALPHTYRGVDAPEDTAVDVVVPGECGGRWRVHRQGGAWSLAEASAALPAATVTLPSELAWRLFTKALPRDEARALLTIAGDRRLGEVLFSALAIVG